MSIFEICSERGKAEKLFDLLSDGSEISMQQSTVKGLKEVYSYANICLFALPICVYRVTWLVMILCFLCLREQVIISNTELAESLIAQATLKRATAMTNTNSQSR